MVKAKQSNNNRPIENTYIKDTSHYCEPWAKY